MNNKNLIPIEIKVLDQWRKNATAKMNAVNYAAPKKATTLSTEDSTVRISIKEDLLVLSKNFIVDALAFSPKLGTAAFALQEGLTLGMYMNEEQKKLLNISDMEVARKDPEYDDKRMSAAAIGLFSFASYMLYLLEHEVKQIEEINFVKDYTKIPDVKINSFNEGVDHIFFFLHESLIKQGYINNEAELVGFLKVFFRDVQTTVALKKDILKADDIFFEKNHYQLTGTNFEINGWEIDNAISTATAVFDEQNFEDIVGNARLKNMLRRLVVFLMAYDFEKKKNPFFEFGDGFSTVVFLHGQPGTGKTMFYRALATLLRKHCEQFGIPYQILDFPKDLVDSYQGKSAQKAKEWFRAYNDPKKITLGGMDDCENVLVDRGGRNASEGTNGIVAVVLTETEGLQKSNKGSRLLLGLTNKIAIIDAAVISRMGIVEEVKGPQSAEDFMDQTHLWMDKMLKFGEGFNLTKPSVYKLMSRQSLEEQKNYPKIEAFVDDKDLLVLYQKTTEKFQGYEWIGQMCYQFQQRFHNFAGRDMRNIHSAILLRMLDFNIPPEWLEDGTVFIKQSYDTKVAMIKKLITENLKGLSFENVVHEETMNYMNNFVKIGADEARKRVNEIIQNRVDYVKAEEEFKLNYPEMAAKLAQ